MRSPTRFLSFKLERAYANNRHSADDRPVASAVNAELSVSATLTQVSETNATERRDQLIDAGFLGAVLSRFNRQRILLTLIGSLRAISRRERTLSMRETNATCDPSQCFHAAFKSSFKPK